MECERFMKLIRNWYLQVQDEALAPARMVDFMRTHLAACPICESDPVVDSEVRKIIEMILPPAKAAKAIERVDGDDDPDEALVDGEGEDREESTDDKLDDEDDLEDIEDEDDDI
jgi:hypothetical protein